MVRRALLPRYFRKTGGMTEMHRSAFRTDSIPIPATVSEREAARRRFINPSFSAVPGRKRFTVHCSSFRSAVIQDNAPCRSLS